MCDSTFFMPLQGYVGGVSLVSIVLSRKHKVAVNWSHNWKSISEFIPQNCVGKMGVVKVFQFDRKSEVKLYYVFVTESRQIGDFVLKSFPTIRVVKTRRSRK